MIDFSKPFENPELEFDFQQYKIDVIPYSKMAKWSDDRQRLAFYQKSVGPLPITVIKEFNHRDGFTIYDPVPDEYFEVGSDLTEIQDWIDINKLVEYLNNDNSELLNYKDQETAEYYTCTKYHTEFGDVIMVSDSHAFFIEMPLDTYIKFKSKYLGISKIRSGI